MDIEVLDVRLGQRGGIVVAISAESVQISLAEAVDSLGAPEEVAGDKRLVWASRTFTIGGSVK